MQDKFPKSPENFIDVKEEEVPNFSDLRVPTSVVDDKKNNINLSPIPEVNIVVPDGHLQREISPWENAVMGMYNNSHAGNKENCINEAKISSQISFERISGSCIEWEASRHVDTNTEVASDRQADDSVHSSKISKAKLSERGVESDDILSVPSLGMYLILYHPPQNCTCTFSHRNNSKKPDRIRVKLVMGLYLFLNIKKSNSFQASMLVSINLAFYSCTNFMLVLLMLYVSIWLIYSNQ